MTTIVADAAKGLMVSDTRCSYNGTTFEIRKIHEMPDGSLVGFAGNSEAANIFLDWMRSGMRPDSRPEFASEEDHFDALVLNADGLFLWGPRLVALRIDNGVYSVGSGSQYAIGAMCAGADPERAVEIAIAKDKHSGHPIQSFAYTAKKVRKAPKKSRLLSD